MLEIHSKKFCNLKVDIWLEVGPSIYVDACYGMFGCYIIAKSFSIIIIIIWSFSIRNDWNGLQVTYKYLGRLRIKQGKRILRWYLTKVFLEALKMTLLKA